MLCAEDEQSRTCWMTAFRLLKVGALPVRVVTINQSVSITPPLAPQYGIVLYQSYNVPQQRKSSLTPFSAPVVRLCSLTSPIHTHARTHTVLKPEPE